jgi:hypothetical protein
MMRGEFFSHYDNRDAERKNVADLQRILIMTPNLIPK